MRFPRANLLAPRRRLHEQLAEARLNLERRDEELATWKQRAEKAEADPFAAERMVWIFGAGRTGSTWLAAMLQDLQDVAIWHEPFVGDLFGSFYCRADAGERAAPHFIMGAHREAWLKSVRRFLLEGAAARFGDHRGLLIVKEPNGSSGADIVAAALPETRLITLIRDPRDVIASVLDAFSEGAWAYERRARGGWDFSLPEHEQANAFLNHRVERVAREMTSALAAFDAPQAPKTLLRYEDLREHPLVEMRRLCDEVRIPVSPEHLRHIVDKHSWESIPAESKGPGKFHRSGRPKGWASSLTEEQASRVEAATIRVIERFQYGAISDGSPTSSP